jgi:serine phosphatase RsbU (regulator of sigma subunit)
VLPLRDRTLVVLVDGLGHGAEAAEASTEAVRVVRESAELEPAALISVLHGALRATRGAAMAVALVHHARRTLVFAGIGNVSAAVHTGDGGSRSLASHNGTVGHSLRKVQEFHYDWPVDGTLLLHTDGINTRWRLDGYPGLLRHDPLLLAGILFRDAARGRDDATVVALREAGS